MTDVPTHTMEEFLAFCKKKGETKFNRLIPTHCAFTQFFRAIYPETYRTIVFGHGGGVRAFDERFELVAIMECDEDDKNAVFRSFGVRTFADMVRVLEA